MEEELNDKLHTDIEWSRMKQDDLATLIEKVDNGELMDILMRHLVSKHGREELDKRIKDWKPGDLIMRLIK